MFIARLLITTSFLVSIHFCYASNNNFDKNETGFSALNSCMPSQELTAERIKSQLYPQGKFNEREVSNLLLLGRFNGVKVEDEKTLKQIQMMGVNLIIHQSAKSCMDSQNFLPKILLLPIIENLLSLDIYHILLDAYKIRINIVKLLNQANNASNEKEKISFYIKAAHLGSMEAQNRVNSFFKYDQKMFASDKSDIDIKQFVSVWKDKKYAIPFFDLAQNFFGKGDINSAIVFYKLAASFGCVGAQCKLAYLHKEGQRIEENEKEDLKFFEEKAQEGVVDAQYILGEDLYHRGEFGKAAEYLLKASFQGNPSSQNILGIMYQIGLGVIKNQKESVEWWIRSAQQGHAKAQNNLAFMYLEGRGVEKDEKEAVKWYRKAAKQGHAQAQYNLAVMYTTQQQRKLSLDDKDQQDRTGEIIYWLKEAASQGVTDAMLNLYSYYSKLGHWEEALFWINKADAAGSPKAAQLLRLSDQIFLSQENSTPELEEQQEQEIEKLEQTSQTSSTNLLNKNINLEMPKLSIDGRAPQQELEEEVDDKPWLRYPPAERPALNSNSKSKRQQLAKIGCEIKKQEEKERQNSASSAPQSLTLHNQQILDKIKEMGNVTLNDLNRLVQDPYFTAKNAKVKACLNETDKGFAFTVQNPSTNNGKPYKATTHRSHTKEQTLHKAWLSDIRYDLIHVLNL